VHVAKLVQLLRPAKQYETTIYNLSESPLVRWLSNTDQYMDGIAKLEEVEE
jgi:hypothetical protein